MKWEYPEIAPIHTDLDASGQWDPSIQRLVAVHAALFALSTIATNAWPDATTVWAACSAIVVSQAMLLLIWLDLVRELTGQKLFLVAGYLLASVFAHNLSAVASEFGVLSVVALAICGFCGIPVALFASAMLAFPLDVARSKGLRLRHFDADEMPAPQPFQFRLAHLLWATAMTAILFALGQLAEIGPQNTGSIQTARAVAELATFVVGLMILLSIPLVGVWAVLTPGGRVPRMAAALFGWGLAVLLIAHYNRGCPDVFFRFGPTLLVATTLVLLTLAQLHRLGYRAIWISNEGEGRSPFRKEPNR